VKSPQETALERAGDYVRDRGWRHTPLTWEEVEAVLDVVDNVDEDMFHIEDIIYHITQVKMSKAARTGLAQEFGVPPETLTPPSP